MLFRSAKSSIFFGPCTHVDIKVEVCTILDIMTEAITDKYLGLPAMVGADRSDCFIHFVERIKQRLKGWMEKHLSLGGKEILLKAVAQAIPVFAMSVFNLPKGVCKEITDVIAQFWWGDDEGDKKMHWYTWWKLCYPKSEGGMGFRDLHSFNLAMLAKQIWRLVTNPDSLCAQILKAKYYPNGSILQAGPKNGSSFTWQSIVAAIPTCKRGIIWRVGSGDNINIWNDPWVPSSIDKRVITPRGLSVLTKVSELICPITGMWDEQMLIDNFNPVDVDRIMRIPLNTQSFDDFIAWHLDTRGIFSVKSAYHAEWIRSFRRHANSHPGQGTSTEQPVWRMLWKVQVPRKIQIFGWRVLHEIIPLKCILANRHIGLSGECPICHQAAEDIKHLLFKCQPAVALWSRLGMLNHIENYSQHERSGSVIFEELLRQDDNSLAIFPDAGFKEILLTGSWYLWWLRRQVTHNESIPPVERWSTSVLAIANNYKKSTAKNSSNVDERWTLPNSGFVKVNVDAAFHADCGSGATAAVIRDFKGNFIAANCAYIDRGLNVVSMEAMAMRDGLNLANSLGFHNVEAESDSTQVISSCSGQSQWWDEAAAIFAEIGRASCRERVYVLV